MQSAERLLTEQKNLRKNRKYLFYAIPTPSKSKHTVWECGFPGPDTDIYKDSYFTVHLIFDTKYPINPPSVKFIDPVYHPNVYTGGNVCLDIISSRWKPSMNVMSVLNGLQHLLENPNIKSPANVPAGQLFRKDRSKYEYLSER
ncbi:ubiquitin-conjugating enzyme E2 [Vairimorpha necatrix]|uniref:Ubiquitin-conjugating enzyme E2 n=1 Tax=Vairimorpha necatrix TaxID=6039 RepID=A0AAX4JCX4_9MICR